MFKKILIPLDGSMRAEQALGLVGKMLPTDDIELVLLEATGDPTLAYPLYGSGVDGYVQIIPEYRKKKVDAYVNTVTQATRTWVPNVRGFSMLGKPDEAIVEVAVKEDVDLIIMVTRGHAGLARLLFGSVTELVIRDAPCPVLAVRDGHLPNHMLIALDGTPFSETILDPAFALARLIKANVTLSYIDEASDDVDMQQVAELSQTNRELAKTLLTTHNTKSENYLDTIYQRFTLKNDVIKINYDIGYGKPSKQILQIAKHHDCDLIAMATHGRQGIDRIWNRSVTEDVMHETKTAMLILHPD